MEKNVSGVDLDELRKAREELDRERGVETGASENLSKFGSFSAFEVKENSTISSDNQEKINNIDEQVFKNEEKVNEKLESVDSEADLDKAISELLDEIEQEDDLINNASTETVNMLDGSPSSVGFDIEAKFDNDLSQTKEVSNGDEITQKTEDIGVEETENIIKNEQSPQTDTNVNDVQEDSGIITNYSQLKEILQNELKESENAIKAKQEEIPEEKFVEIDDFKFTNEIAEDSFKNADKFSYIMGKNEDGVTIFGNLKEHLNLAVFGKNDEVVNSFLNSLILCMCLKNSYTEINFALLDSNIDSAFDVYNKSSYLYFNRIAKTNKEIRDTLIEISKEVDSRYDKLASVGVKTIEEYNATAVRNGFSTIPYIIVVFNNYTSASQATDNDKINACLYQILKFGRIAGIYCILSAKLSIENSQVNYNLSSRLSFKSDNDSMFTIGEAGNKSLKEENDALYFNISSGEVKHIKTAKVTENELELIIKDLED